MYKFAANGPECQVVRKARCGLNEMLSIIELQNGEETAPTTHRFLSNGSILLSEGRVSSSSLRKW